MSFYRFLLVISAIALSSFTLEANYCLPVDSIPSKKKLGAKMRANAPTKPKVTIPDEALDIGNGEHEVFKVVEEMPTFPGGEKAMYQFIADKLQYPAEAKANKMQGNVYVRFTVTPSGELKDIEMVKGLPVGGLGINDEALRIVKSMPKWNPGRQRGKAVYVSYLLPVRFKLDTPRKPYPGKGKIKMYNPPSNMKEKTKIKTSSEPTTTTSTSSPKTKAINVKKSGQSLEDKAKTKIPTSSKPDTPPSNTIPIIEEGENIELDKVGPDGIAVYKTVPEMPTFPDGQMAFFRFIGKNVSYPPDARKNSLQGTAYVGFTVMEDGSLKNFHIKQGVAGAPSCDAEALRVMQLSPDWNPGTINGKPVRVSMVTPIRFILNNGNKNYRKGKRTNKFYRSRN